MAYDNLTDRQRGILREMVTASAKVGSERFKWFANSLFKGLIFEHPSSEGAAVEVDGPDFLAITHAGYCVTPSRSGGTLTRAAFDAVEADFRGGESQPGVVISINPATKDPMAEYNITDRAKKLLGEMIGAADMTRTDEFRYLSGYGGIRGAEFIGDEDTIKVPGELSDVEMLARNDLVSLRFQDPSHLMGAGTVMPKGRIAAKNNFEIPSQRASIENINVAGSGPAVFGNMHGTIINQNGKDQHATVQHGITATEALNLLESCRSAVSALPGTDKADAEHALDELAEEAKSPTPNMVRIRRAIGYLTIITAGVEGADKLIAAVTDVAVKLGMSAHEIAEHVRRMSQGHS